MNQEKNQNANNANPQKKQEQGKPQDQANKQQEQGKPQDQSHKQQDQANQQGGQKNQQQGGMKTPQQQQDSPRTGQQGSGNQVGIDADNDGRAVQPGHKPGDVDGDQQRHCSSA